MIWAIDLDDGTLIDALGSNMERGKREVFNDTFPTGDLPLFGHAGGSEEL